MQLSRDEKISDISISEWCSWSFINVLFLTRLFGCLNGFHLFCHIISEVFMAVSYVLTELEWNKGDKIPIKLTHSFTRCPMGVIMHQRGSFRVLQKYSLLQFLPPDSTQSSRLVIAHSFHLVKPCPLLHLNSGMVACWNGSPCICALYCPRLPSSMCGVVVRVTDTAAPAPADMWDLSTHPLALCRPFLLC